MRSQVSCNMSLRRRWIGSQRFESLCSPSHTAIHRLVREPCVVVFLLTAAVAATPYSDVVVLPGSVRLQLVALQFLITTVRPMYWTYSP